jgi:integrase/recombinase XerD
MRTSSFSIGPSGIGTKCTDAFGIQARRFIAHLEGLGYSRWTVADYSWGIHHLSAVATQRNITLSELNELRAVELLSERKIPPSVQKLARRGVVLFARFLQDQGFASPPAVRAAEPRGRALLRRDFEDYLRNQRGVCACTMHRNVLVVEQFLKFRFGDGEDDLSAITPGDIAEFMRQLHSRKEPYRVKTIPTHLRNFFRFLFRAGKTRINLAPGIPSVAHRYGARLRRHLTAEQVETVLAAVRSDTHTGRRNFAMMLLMARLGLRAPEVIAMQVDDIDWRAGEVLIRGKGQRHDRVPLPVDVGQALADYIRIDRVTDGRSLFVSKIAPHRPFKDGQVLNTVLKDAFAKTGVKPPAPYVGSHVLRHSLAVNLVRKGAPLSEISDMLRHRSRASTLIYAKLDVEGLRSIAQPWPVTGGAK